MLLLLFFSHAEQCFRTFACAPNKCLFRINFKNNISFAMFTGIVAQVARLRWIDANCIQVEAGDAFWHGVRIGDSIAVAGVCLTVTAIDNDGVNAKFFVSAETQRVTTLKYVAGVDSQLVNVEKSLQLSNRLGGHVTSGHVHCVGSVVRVQPDDDQQSLLVDICAPNGEFSQPVTHKGSVAIDGVSLTVARIVAQTSATSTFQVMLIPHTQQNTTLGALALNTAVNVEFCSATAACSSSPPATLEAVDAQHSDVDTPVWRDCAFMRQAICKGERGRLSAPPNPWVGCVLVDEHGIVLSSGFHARAGQPHAEIEAMRRVEPAARLRGCTCYVTLEPCSHTGRTGPCCDALVAAGVRRVVVGVLDPDQRVSGRGVQALRAAGVRVDVGVCARDVRRSLRHYLHQRQEKRAFCIVKVAASLDGAIACADGTSQWITGQEARRHAHAQRARCQAIVIGRQTAIADNPQLTVRGVDEASDKQQPWRVVLDVDAKTADRNLQLYFDEHASRTIVFTRKPLANFGRATVDESLRVGANNLYAAKDVLERLASRYGVITCLIEGGALTHSHFLPAADEVHVYTGAVALGRGAHSWLRHAELGGTIGDAPRFVLRESFAIGNDVFSCYDAHADDLPEHDCTENTVDAALRALQRGQLVCVRDDESRENEADLIGAARSASAEQLAFTIRYSSGIVCAPMPAERADALQLSPMTNNECNEDPNRTAYTVSCDVRDCSTGVSAADRAHTLRALADCRTPAHCIRRPGHIFPLRARGGGVLERPGHTESAVDLCRWAGIDPPVAFIAELVSQQPSSNGDMMRAAECAQFCAQHNIPNVSVQQLRDYARLRAADKQKSNASGKAQSVREEEDDAIACSAACDLLLGRNLGTWRFHCFESGDERHPHKVLTRGIIDHAAGQQDDDDDDNVPLCRVHSECFTGDVLHSQLCDCRQQLDMAFDLCVAEQRAGIIMILSGHEGRGINLTNKIRAYDKRQTNPQLDTYVLLFFLMFFFF